jgi:hypothetical protein
MQIEKNWEVALSIRFLPVALFSLRAQRRSAIRSLLPPERSAASVKVGSKPPFCCGGGVYV